MSSPHSPVFEALLPTPLGPMVALASDAALECLYALRRKTSGFSWGI